MHLALLQPDNTGEGAHVDNGQHCGCGRAPLAMTGLVQYQPNAKSANKEVEDINIAMALCTQRAHLKPLCFSVCSTYSLLAS